MVVTLGPGRFYGSGLPRPWFHPDVKFAEERVDPPPRVLDPLLRWAQEAHWSMGGLSFQRHRLQGRIEGSIKKIRAEAERAVRSASRTEKKRVKTLRQQSRREGEERNRKRRLLSESDDDGEDKEEGRDAEVKEDEEARVGVTTSGPRPLRQRRRRVAILDEGTSDSDHGEEAAKQGAASAPSSLDPPRRRSARRLGIEFDRVAASRSPKDGRSQRI